MATANINFYALLNDVWTDITSDVQVTASPTAFWGMRSNRPDVKIASTGTLTFDLDNVSKQYNPDGSSPLSGWGKGTAIKVVFTFGRIERTRFRGFVEKIDIDAGINRQRKAHVTVLDWMDYAAKYPIEIPAIEEDKTADYAVNVLVNAMPIAPQNTSFDEGVTTFPTIFDDASTQTNAYAEFTKFINSESGLLYLNFDQTYGETLVLKNFTSRSGTTPISVVALEGSDEFLLKTDGDNVLKIDGSRIRLMNMSYQEVDIDNEFSSVETAYGDKIANYVTSSAYPKRTSTTELIYRLENALQVGSGLSESFRVQYTDSSSKRKLAALPPDNEGTIILLKGEEAGVVDETGREWTAVDVTNYTLIKKFGVGSLFFDGTLAYAYTADSPDFDFGTRDFTVEFWLYHTGGAAGQTICRRNMTSAFPAFALGRSDGTNMLIDMSSNGSSNDIANGKSWGAISFDTWAHYALCRSGSNFYAFKDGVLTDSWTSSGSLFPESDVLSIGRNNATYFEGFIDEFRIVLDTAVYTATFTPPTNEFTLDGLVYAAATSGGTNINDSVDISVSYGGVGADITITNNYSETAYINILDIYSRIVQSDVPIVNIQQDTTSISSHGYQTVNLHMPYQQNPSIGAIEGAKIIEKEKDPRLTINKVTMVANRSNFLMSCFLNTNIGDLVKLTEDQTEIESLYWINGIEWRILDGSVIEFSWYVKDFNSLVLGLSPIAVEFDASSTDGINFGYLPHIDNTLHNDYTIATWIYIDGSTGDYQNVVSVHSDNGGVRFGLHNSDNRNIYLYDSFFAGSGLGIWRTTGTPSTYGAWHHIVVTYNSLATSDPTIYVDGSSVAITEVNTPTGEKDTNTFPIMVLGNTKTSTVDFSWVMDGKQKDTRIYNRIITASEVSTLYNSGTPDADLVTDGLVFQAFCVRTKDLVDYTDEVLTSSLKVLDNINGIVGIPNGTPTGRAF